MSWQKEKGLLPQKKNLKPKRESEASAAEAENQKRCEWPSSSSALLNAQILTLGH
jgi:hypothetical protein